MSGARLDHEDGLTLLVLESPILSTGLLHDLDDALAEASRTSPPEPLVLSSEHPRIFLAGAHLGEIEDLDARSADPYASFGRRVLSRLSSHPAPTVAAVHGPCTGGGFDLLLNCDAVTAGTRAVFGHPGVKRGLVTGWGGTLLVASRLGNGPAVGTLVQGRFWSADEALVMGLVRTVKDDVGAAARAEARRLSTIHPARLELWRSLLRRSFVDTFRTFVVHNRG